MRHVLLVLTSRRQVFDVRSPIGAQCLETNFKHLALWRPEFASPSKMPITRWGMYTNTIAERVHHSGGRKPPAAPAPTLGRPASAPALTRPNRPTWRAAPSWQRHRAANLGSAHLMIRQMSHSPSQHIT